MVPPYASIRLINEAVIPGFYNNESRSACPVFRFITPFFLALISYYSGSNIPHMHTRMKLLKKLDFIGFDRNFDPSTLATAAVFFGFTTDRMLLINLR
jgi:hypothetical protein